MARGDVQSAREAKGSGTFLEKHDPKMPWQLNTWLPIIVGVVVLGAIGTAIYNHNAATNYALPTPPPIGGTLPPAIANATANQGSMIQDLAALSANTFVANNQFHANYSGSLSVSPSGYLSFVPGFTSLMKLRDAKYNGLVKLDVNVTSVPIMGAADVRYAKEANGTYVCANFNQSAANKGNMQVLLTGSHAMNCQYGSSIVGLNMAALANLNFTQMQNMGFVFKLNRTYQTSVSGGTCSYITGNLFQEAANGTIIGSGTYAFCISNQYYVPVMMAFTLTNKNGAFYAILNVTDIGNSASQQFVTTLP